MATKYFCDACGKEIAMRVELNTVEIKCTSEHNRNCIRKIDLCNSCYDRFIDKLYGDREELALFLTAKED